MRLEREREGETRQDATRESSVWVCVCESVFVWECTEYSVVASKSLMVMGTNDSKLRTISLYVVLGSQMLVRSSEQEHL